MDFVLVGCHKARVVYVKWKSSICRPPSYEASETWGENGTAGSEVVDCLPIGTYVSAMPRRKHRKPGVDATTDRIKDDDSRLGSIGNPGGQESRVRHKAPLHSVALN